MFKLGQSLIAAAALWLVICMVALGTQTKTKGRGAANPLQHGALDGHLLGTGAYGVIAFEGQLTPDAGNLVGDVAVSPDGNWAFLATAGQTTCSESVKKTSGAGVWVVNISDPAHPQLAGFIPHDKGSLPGEGLQVVEITTEFFSGWALGVSSEPCGKKAQGGVSLYDVTNPLKPYKLSQHFGGGGFNAAADAQSAFAWDAGDRAYVATGGDSGPTSVVILDITNPRRPRLVAEYDLSQFDIDQPELMLDETSLQSITVKQIAGQFMMLLSAGDGGHVLLDVTDPANAVYIGDTDFFSIDPQLLESTGITLTPEGNAHQAEFTADNRLFIGTDLDSSPFRGSQFDGWGYVHLYNRATLQELDTFAIPEAMDPAFASGFGNLSVQEVGTHPTSGDIAYLAYNSGGLRAVQIQCSNPDDTSTCEIVEIGGYLDPQGNNFSGVEVFVKGGQTYVLASDRESGLWIFRGV